MSRLDKVKELVEKLEFRITGFGVKAGYGLTISLKGKTGQEVIYVPFSDRDWVEIFFFSAEKIGVPRD